MDDEPLDFQDLPMPPNLAARLRRRRVVAQSRGSRVWVAAAAVALFAASSALSPEGSTWRGAQRGTLLGGMVVRPVVDLAGEEATVLAVRGHPALVELVEQRAQQVARCISNPAASISVVLTVADQAELEGSSGRAPCLIRALDGDTLRSLPRGRYPLLVSG